MENVKRALYCTTYGVKDCITGMFSLINILNAQDDSNRGDVQLASRQSHVSTVKNKLVQCTVFGLCFWLSNYIFNTFMIDCVITLFVEWFGENANNVVWLIRLLYVFFFCTWIFPLFVISKLLNFIWYQDIADLIFVSSGIRRNTSMRFSDFYADQIKSLLLQIFYCCQGYAVYFVPLPVIVQYAWYLFHLALLSSLYAFEYKWVHIGWPLHRRLLNIDRKWPYYLGFGLPLAVVTTLFVSFIDSMIVFATLFPIYVISSANTSDSQSPIFSHPFHSFKIADSVSDVFVAFCMKLFSASVTFFGR